MNARSTTSAWRVTVAKMFGAWWHGLLVLWRGGLCCDRSRVGPMLAMMLPGRDGLRSSRGDVHGMMHLWVVHLCAVGEKVLVRHVSWCEVVCAAEVWAALGYLNSQILLVLHACGCPVQVVLDLSGSARVARKGLVLLLLSLPLSRMLSCGGADGSHT